MQLDHIIKKFLSSKYGQDIVKSAYLYGQETFKYGKKKYKLKDLKHYIDSINIQII